MSSEFKDDNRVTLQKRSAIFSTSNLFPTASNYNDFNSYNRLINNDEEEE